MKFKDKDGNVFASMGSACAVFCCNRVCESEECALYELTEAANIECMDWAIDHPAEAARLMGYEVVEDESEKGCNNCGRFPKDSPPCGYADDCYTPPNDPPSAPSHWTPRKETNMDKQKPRICEVLGVEVGERFQVESRSCIFYHKAFVDEYGIVRAYAGQSMKGMHICQLISGELHLVRPPRFTEEEAADARAIMRLFPYSWETIRRDKDGVIWLEYDGQAYGAISRDLFPSIRPSQSVKLSEIVGGAE